MIHTITGSSWLSDWFLSALSPALAGGRNVFWIDVGNRFDAYGLGRSARERGLDPRRALAGVKLARPFNAYQLETMIATKLPDLWNGEPIVLSDPFTPFLDEDFPLPDAERILPRVIAAMRRLPALWIVLAVERKSSPERRFIENAFLKESDKIARFSEISGPLNLAALGLNLELSSPDEERAERRAPSFAFA